MEYSIKEIARCVEISEQGLYKRIKTNYEDYLKKGFIVVNQVEQPSGTKEQIFITRKGLEDLLKTKPMRKGATLKGFEALNQKTKPLNQVEQPLNQDTKPKDVQTASDNLLNLLNQNIADLKAENKRLNDKLEKQEARFDKKLEEQKQEFKEQYEKQQELYQKTLDRIMQSFQNALLQLPKPNEEETETHKEATEIIQEPIKEDATLSTEEAERETEKEQEAEQKEKGVKSFFKRLFSK